jgi:ADP-ribose pyrophosphatase
MAAPTQPLADAAADVVIEEPELLAAGFRSYQRLRYRRAGEGGPPQLRDVLRAGASAAVLPVDLVRDEVVLLRQFRLPAQLAAGRGDLVEIVAGHVEPGEPPAVTARRECLEEIGVVPDPLIELLRYFTSPGMSDEEITLFLGIVDAARVPARAGLAAEHEETVMVRLPLDGVPGLLAGGTVHNGPLIVALQWLALNRGRLREIAALR